MGTSPDQRPQMWGRQRRGATGEARPQALTLWQVAGVHRGQGSVRRGGRAALARPAGFEPPTYGFEEGRSGISVVSPDSDVLLLPASAGNLLLSSMERVLLLTLPIRTAALPLTQPQPALGVRVLTYIVARPRRNLPGYGDLST